jgi:hypothetical protein
MPLRLPGGCWARGPTKEPDLLRFVFAGSGYIIATAIAC